MIATAEWRNAGHRPGDTPAIGVSALEGGLLIHLHASPESMPAWLRAAIWKEHAALYKHRFMRAPKLTTETMGPWAQLKRQHDQSMYEYWQELQAQPGQTSAPADSLRTARSSPQGVGLWSS